MMKKIYFISFVGILSSCCCQEQGAPALRPMPNCDEHIQIQPTYQIPVERTCK